MTHDITKNDENKQIETEQVQGDSVPPLCLVHYFVERAAYPPERPLKPPGNRLIGRVAERRGNLIILEFAPPPVAETTTTKWQGGRHGKSGLMRFCDGLVLLLLLACLVGCLAAFRF